MEGVAWLGVEDFTEQFYFKLNLVTKVIASDGDSLEANLKEKSIVIIVNLEKDVS